MWRGKLRTWWVVILQIILSLGLSLVLTVLTHVPFWAILKKSIKMRSIPQNQGWLIIIISLLTKRWFGDLWTNTSLLQTPVKTKIHSTKLQIPLINIWTKLHGNHLQKSWPQTLAIVTNKLQRTCPLQKSRSKSNSVINKMANKTLQIITLVINVHIICVHCQCTHTYLQFSHKQCFHQVYCWTPQLCPWLPSLCICVVSYFNLIFFIICGPCFLFS